MDWDKTYSLAELFKEGGGVATGVDNASNNYAKGGKIEDRIKTFEDAKRELRIDEKDEITFLELFGTSGRDRESISAYYQLIIIARALNEGWVPNWADSNEYKYYPYFEWNEKTSGFVFSRTYYDGTTTLTSVGSRLCFKSEELAEYAGKAFIKIYAKLLNP